MLREENPMGVTSDSYVEKMMENAKIRHRKFRTKKSDDVIKKSLGRSRKYDIINIKEYVCSVRGGV
jgi:phosphopantetheine adenylyltransferase